MHDRDSGYFNETLNTLKTLLTNYFDPYSNLSYEEYIRLARDLLRLRQQVEHEQQNNKPSFLRFLNKILGLSLEIIKGDMLLDTDEKIYKYFEEHADDKLAICQKWLNKGLYFFSLGFPLLSSPGYSKGLVSYMDSVIKSAVLIAVHAEHAYHNLYLRKLSTKIESAIKGSHKELLEILRRIEFSKPRKFEKHMYREMLIKKMLNDIITPSTEQAYKKIISDYIGTNEAEVLDLATKLQQIRKDTIILTNI